MRHIKTLWFIPVLTLLASSCSAESEPAAPEPGPESAGVILQYHHVDATTPRITSTTPDEFRAHMAHLREADFEVWHLGQLIDAVRAGAPTPERVVAITFDDAYESIYTEAFPILQEYGWPFTIFVATEPVESRRPGFLSWAQLREMEAATNGAMIANHTHTHAHLLRKLEGETDDEWLARVAAELNTAQALLEENLASPEKRFAYTYGEYDPDVLEVIESLGYDGMGQQSGAIGTNMRFSLLPRFPFGGVYNNLEQFKTKVLTLPMPIEPLLADPMITDDLTPSITLNFSREDLRLHQLVCYTPGGGTATLERDGLSVTVTTEKNVPVGRSRYNCTMPSSEPGRFYWFSQLWIRKRPDGTWYPEP